MSKTQIPTAEELRNKLKRAVEKKKKENKLAPLLERLFDFHVDISFIEPLIQLVGSDSRKVARYAYHFLSNFITPPDGLPADLMKLLVDTLKKETSLSTPLRAVMALRSLANLTKTNPKDTSLITILMELLGKFGEEDAKNPTLADKKKKAGSRGSVEQLALDMLQAECFCALRTRSQLDPAFYPHILRGITAIDSHTARHAMALAYQISQTDQQGAATMVGPFLSSAEKSRSAELNTADISSRVYYIRLLSELSNSSLPDHVTFRKELLLFVSDPSDRVSFEAIAGLVESNFERLQKMTIPGPDKELPLIPTLKAKLIKSLSSNSTTEIHAAVKVSKLLAESYIVHFERSQNKGVDRSADFSGEMTVNSSEMSGEDSLLEASVKDLSSSEDESESNSASTTSKKSSTPSKKSKTKAKKLKTKKPSSNTLAIPSSAPKRKAKAVKEAAPKRRRRGRSVTEHGSDTESESASAGGPIVRSTIRSRLAKTLSVYETEEILRKTHEEATEKLHPLNDLRNTILLLFKNKSSGPYVRSRSLIALIWLSYAWNSARLEETILGENHSLPGHLYDEVLEELHWRVKTTPNLVETVLSLFYQLYCTVPTKVNVASLLSVWRTIIEMRDGKAKVLANAFKILDELHRRDTRLVAFNVQKSIFWFLGEMANTITSERVFLPKKFANAVDADAASDSNPEYEIQNKAMKSIILRLENAIAYCPWEIRTVCVEALAKIAFQSSFPLRLHVYEFLLLTASEDGSCMYPIVVPILQILDKLFELRSRWLKFFKRGETGSPEDKQRLRKDIDAVRLKMAFYCPIKEYLKNPLGADVALFLREGK